MNDRFVQLNGPFNKNEELVSRIRETVPGFKSIVRIGIQTGEGKQCEINNDVFEIGRNEILEFHDVEVTSFKFLQDEPESTIIDCLLGD